MIRKIWEQWIKPGGLAIPRGLAWLARLGWRGIKRTGRECGYWLRLFWFTSRRFLRVELLLAILGALIFFGVIVTQDYVRSQRAMLEHCYLFFSAIVILFAMNLIPREREEETLEILWSQPMQRSQLVLLQLLTLTVWVSIMCVGVVAGFSPFMPYSEPYLYFIPLFVVTTGFTVGTITVLVSTFTRQAIATGLVSLLILGAHFFWIREMGPINLFYNPIPFPGETLQGGLLSFVPNRIFVLVLTGFILDYLFRRLKRTAEWFT